MNATNTETKMMTSRYTKERLSAIQDAFDKGYSLGQQQRRNGEWIMGSRADFDGEDVNYNSFVNGYQCGYNHTESDD